MDAEMQLVIFSSVSAFLKQTQYKSMKKASCAVLQ
jgi:hypothetical protein